MPRRVRNFLRPPSSSLEKLVAHKKTVTDVIQRRDSPNRTDRSSQSAGRVFTYASSVEDDAENCTPPPHVSRRRMGESRSSSFSSSDGPKELFHHRISFPGVHFGRLGKEHHHHHACVNASLRWELESPPIVFYGDAESSTGALVSGQLFVDVKEEELEIESFNATLNIHVTQKRPFASHCHDCANQYTELKKWTFLPQPVAMKRGQHAFPFSVLLGGHLPISMDGPVVSIAYEFRAEAIPRGAGASPVAPIKLEKVLDVKRSLRVNELPHHSVRVFPPTNIKASVHYPQIIYPTGSNTLSIKLDGIARHNAKVNTIEYWKLKKLSWRLEETVKTVAPSCDKHVPKDTTALVETRTGKKGIARTEMRILGSKTLLGGWKSDYVNPADSSIELELEYDLNNHVRFNCDTKTRDGSEVTHQLLVEMVVSQEWAPCVKPSLVSQTGIGRILRMHFSTVITERGGIGISWDNEAPPIYQDVPPSPPGYLDEAVIDADCDLEGTTVDPRPLVGLVRDTPNRLSLDAVIARAAGTSVVPG